MQKYELLLVLPGTFDEKEAETEADKILAIVNEFGNEATSTTLGKNRLAYPIKQIRYGYFYTIIFSAEAEKIKDLKNKMNLDKNILRAFITKYNDKLSQAQKISYFNAEVREESEEEVKPRTERSSNAEEEIKNVEPVKEEEVKPRVEQSSDVIEKTMDMKDIDKKLDEILADDNLMTKV